MNINSETPPDDVGKLLSLSQHNHQEDLSRALTESVSALQSIKEKRLSERFYFVVAIILLLDICLLQKTNNILTLFFVIVESIIILSLADRWSVNSFCDWTNKGISLFHRHCDIQIAKFKKGKE